MGIAVVVAAFGIVGCATSADEGNPKLRSALLQPSTTNANAEPNAKNASGLVASVLGRAEGADPGEVCPGGMVAIEGRYCIDRYEATLIEMLPSGEEQPFSPYSTVGSRNVRAISAPNVYPQGYISAVQAERACTASGKRLCRIAEWQQACRGPQNQRYGYGEAREPGRCNDRGRSPVIQMFGFRYDETTMNHPQLNQLAGTLAKTGEHEGCSNGYGVYDMVGNLHEWVADPNGTFYGGYYQDVASVGHGDGCGYRTTAHEARYHDYSTGFRCCSDLLGQESAATQPQVAPKRWSKPAPKPAALKAPKRR
jgi:hypothetical protein